MGTSGGSGADFETGELLIYCAGGTLGSLLEDQDGRLFILSNNHVIARSNQGVIGEGILQQGLLDANCNVAVPNKVGDLSGFKTIKESNNKVDAAIAESKPGVGAGGRQNHRHRPPVQPAQEGHGRHAGQEGRPHHRGHDRGGGLDQRRGASRLYHRPSAPKPNSRLPSTRTRILVVTNKPSKPFILGGDSGYAAGGRPNWWYLSRSGRTPVRRRHGGTACDRQQGV